MRRRILAVTALAATVAPAACRRSNPTPPVASSPAPTPPQPATAPTPTPTPVANPAPLAATAIAPTNAQAATAYPTEQAAVAALSSQGLTLGTPSAIADFDGDGETDRLFNHDDACVLVRHSPAGFIAESFSPETASDGVQCIGTVNVGGTSLVGVVGTGHDVDNGRSFTWASMALFAPVRGRASVTVLEHRVETNNGSQGEWTFTAGTDGTLVVAANPGDDLPAGASPPFYAMYRWDAAQNRFAQASCWASSRPAGSPTPQPGCTVTPRASFHLRRTENLAAAEGSTEMPAGSQLRVVSPGTLTRGEARLHCVSTASGEMGYAFLTPAELSGCAAP